MTIPITEIISRLEALAPPAIAEDYDNTGLITGDKAWQCSGILCCLDATLPVLEEALTLGCNMVIAHHPILFRKIKSLSGNHYTLQAIRFAIKNDIAIYAIHTNLDNVLNGVNSRIASAIGLASDSLRILSPKPGLLSKLYTYIPPEHFEKVQQAIFAAGGGQISNYSECSFSTDGHGTFRPSSKTNPFIGVAGGPREYVQERKLEVVFETYKTSAILQALTYSHPYEEVAYEIISLQNSLQDVGSGIIGRMERPIEPGEFLEKLAAAFGTKAIRHTRYSGKTISTVAICGGAGSFLIQSAMASGADAFVTADLKYHEYFEAGEGMLLADIGHYESEQYTITLLQQYLHQYFPTFAVLSTKVNTNPTNIFVAKG